MLRLLLDIHVKPAIAAQVLRIRPECPIVSLLHWHDGTYRTASDEEILRAAYDERLALVTYDQRTIPPLLRRQALRGIPHGGVVFVDSKSMRPDDVGSLVRSLCMLWDTRRDDDWVNRVHYLRPDAR